MALPASRALIAAAALASLVACGGSKKKTADLGAPEAGGLWALAPEGAVGGIVVADGTLATAHEWLVEIKRVADANAVTRKIAAEVVSELASGPVNPFDGESLSRAGIDVTKGLAVWVDAADAVYAVLPVADRARFVGLVGGRTVEEGGAEVDIFNDDMRCQMRRGRYLCAPQLAALDAMGATPNSALAEQARALPPELSGHVTAVFDGPRYDLARRIPGIERYLTDLGTLAIAATLADGKLTIRAHLPGTLAPEGRRLVAAPSLLAGKAGAERPSGGLRVRLDPNMIDVPDGGSIPMAGLQIADLLRSFTGELVAVSHAGTNGSIAVQVGLSSADALRQLVQVGCGAAGLASSAIKLRMDGERCRGTVSFEALPAEARRMFRQSQVDVDVGVESDRVEARLSVGTRGPSANAPGPGALGQELLAGEWNVAMWGSGLSPIFLLEVLELSAVPPSERDQATAALWMLGHLYEAGAGVGFREDGLHAMAQVTSFAAAPDEAYAAYEGALTRALAGDLAGATTALTEAARQAPDSIIARQLGLKSSAYVGVGVLVGAAAALLFARAAAPVEEVAPPPPVVAPTP